MVVPALYAVAALSCSRPSRSPSARSRRDHASSMARACSSPLMLVVVGLLGLRRRAGVERRSLPLGLPWLGAHFRLDALAAFFLVVVNLGGAAASLYALGYGRHEEAPQRVLPFFPAFLAA